MTSKTPDELALMSPEERAAWRAQEEIAIWGAGFKRDRNGRPIEQGIGCQGKERDKITSRRLRSRGQGRG